jgi:hypothetical protein
VAVILGLLLVVTFIANYLATTLPNTMGQNDLQHELAVENQVAQLSARMQAIAFAGAVGAQVSQPVSLGSAGAPPFAGPDSGYLTALSSVANTSGNHPQSGLNFTLAGPTRYLPPTGFGLNLKSPPSGCTYNATTFNCPAINKAIPIKWNFTGLNGKAITVTLGTGGNLVLLNFSTNNSAITVSGLSGMPTYVQVLGNNNTLTLTNNGGGNNPISVNITGSYNTIATNSFPGGASTIIIHVIGDNNLINGDAASSGGGNTFYVSIIGTGNALALTPSGGDAYYAYVTGFDILNPTSASCPYGALSHNNPITGYNNGIGTSKNAKLYETFNNSTSYPGGGTVHPGSQSGPPYKFTITNSSVASFNCPFTSGVSVPFTPAGVAGFVVHLQNLYAPTAEVAYDEGSVVFAQPGGTPIFVVPPPITFGHGVLTLFVPWLSNVVMSEAGTGTADVSLHLLSTTSFTMPSNGFALPSGSQVTFTVVSPYAAAWYNFFHATSSPFSSYVTCTGSGNVCTAVYNPGGAAPLGRVTVAIPVSAITTLNVVTAVYSVFIL